MVNINTIITIMFPYNTLMLDFLDSVYQCGDKQEKGCQIFIWVYKGESIILTTWCDSKNNFSFFGKNPMYQSLVKFVANDIFVNDEIVTSLDQLFRCLQTDNSLRITTRYNNFITPENLFIEQQFHKFYMKYI